jgi:hypothetical protein
MKKLLLSCLSFSLFVGVQAQSQNVAVRQNTSLVQKNKIENVNSSFFSTAQNRQHASNVIRAPRSTTNTYISSSYNAFGIIVTEANCLTANQATNTVLFTHRINPDIHGVGSATAYSGFIQPHFTSDYGVTWDSLIETSDQVNLCRYPSGTLYNRASNTVRDSLYTVVTGPITNGTNWMGNYFADIKLDGTNNTVNMALNATAGVTKQDYVRIGMQQMGQNKVVVTGGLYQNANGTTAATQMFRGGTINYGTWNAASNNFTWTIDSIKPHLKIKSLDNTKYTYSEVIPAFAEDGVTGYIIFSGVDSLATGSELSFQPIVYKTTNSGASWTQMPLFDYSSIPVINNKLMTTYDGVTKKAWYSMENGFDAVVDNANNLHIVCGVASATSVSPDSLDYAFIRADRKTYIFDTHTTTGGSWDAFLVDSLLTVPDTNTFIDSQTNTKMALDARIQATRTTDGSKIFYEWLDCDPTISQSLNAVPDIHAKGLDVATGNMTPTTTFTFDGIYYYMFASNIALVSGSTYNIPCTYSSARSGNDAITPFNHYFVSGVQFTDTDFGNGIQEYSSNGNLQISQNYPNPFNKTTSVNVTLKYSKNVSFDVFNTLGEKILTQNYDKLSTGTHTLTIDGSKLSAGVYFYTIKAGNDSITRKMIVQ